MSRIAHTQSIDNLRRNKAVLPDIVLDSDPQSEVSPSGNLDLPTKTICCYSSKISPERTGKISHSSRKPGVELQTQLSNENTSQPMSLDSSPLPDNNCNNVPVSRTDQHSEAKAVHRPFQFTGEIGELRSVYELPPEYRHIFSSYPAFNTIQSHVFDDVMYSDRGLVISAPTGSGKTVIFELAIIRLLMKMEDKKSTENFKIIYMAPVKALCTERFLDWSEKFSSLGLRCQEITGDSHDSQIEDLLNYNLLFTTPEKWDSLTRKWRQNQRLVEVVKLFLLDEVHLVSDEKRGPTLEAVVSRMKTVEESMEYTKPEAYYSDINIRFVAVSATIPNIEDIAAWLGDSVHPAIHMKYGEEFRPVQLKQVVLGFYSPPGQSPYLFEMKLNYRLREILFKYSESKPSLIFCSTRKGVLQTVATLSQQITFRLNKDQREKLFLAAKNLMDNKLEGFVMAGVGAHHAGMTVTDRHIMEDLFRQSLLPVLVTTSTLAMGVNLPAHLVIVKSTQQYMAGIYQDYSDSQLLQMIGRAGRPQFDSSATAVIMTKEEDRARYLRLVSGSQLLESSLHRHLGQHLNSEIVLGTITDKYIAMKWMRSTFLYVRAIKNPKHYGIAGQLSQCEIENKLQDLVMRELNILARANLINMDDIMDLKSTEAGRLMATYYLPVKTMESFNSITGDETLENIVSLIANSSSFSDIQLRRVEKKTLNELNHCRNKECIRFPVKGLVQDSATKVNVLMQAMLGCLPIHDHSLHQDAVSIMRAGERVTKCLAKYLFQQKNYKSLLNGTLLAKCFYAKLWENSIYVSRQLKGIGPVYSAQLASAGKTTFQSINNANPRDLERILNKPPPLGNELKEATSHLPQYNVVVDLDSSLSKAVITVVLENLEAISEYNTAGPYHWLTFIVRDSRNKILVKERFKDDFIIQMGGCRTWNIVLDASVEEIYANLISDQWVGIDIHLGTEITKSKEGQRTMKESLEKYVSKRDFTNKMPHKPKKLTITEEIKKLGNRIPDMGVRRLVYESTPNLKQTYIDRFLYTPIQRKKLLPWKESTRSNATLSSKSLDVSLTTYNSSSDLKIIEERRSKEIPNCKQQHDDESDAEWIECTPSSNVTSRIQRQSNYVYAQNNPTIYPISTLVPNNSTKYPVNATNGSACSTRHLDEIYKIRKEGNRIIEKKNLQFEYDKKEGHFLYTTELNELKPTAILKDKISQQSTNAHDKKVKQIQYEERFINRKTTLPSDSEDLVRKCRIAIGMETNAMQTIITNENQNRSSELDVELFEGNVSANYMQENRDSPLLVQGSVGANLKCHLISTRCTEHFPESNQCGSNSIPSVTESHWSENQNLIESNEVCEPITEEFQENISASSANIVKLPVKVGELQHRQMLPTQGIGKRSERGKILNTEECRENVNQPAIEIEREQLNDNLTNIERRLGNAARFGNVLSKPETNDGLKMVNNLAGRKHVPATIMAEEMIETVKQCNGRRQQSEGSFTDVHNCSEVLTTLKHHKDNEEPLQSANTRSEKELSHTENMVKIQLSGNEAVDCSAFKKVEKTCETNYTKIKSMSEKQLQGMDICTTSVETNFDFQNMRKKDDSNETDRKTAASERKYQNKNTHKLKRYYPIFFNNPNSISDFQKNSEDGSSENDFRKTSTQSNPSVNLSLPKDDLKLNLNSDKLPEANYSDSRLPSQMPKVSFDVGLEELLQSLNGMESSPKPNSMMSDYNVGTHNDQTIPKQCASFRQQSIIKNFKLHKPKWNSEDTDCHPVMKLLYGSPSPPNNREVAEKKLEAVSCRESSNMLNSQRKNYESQRLPCSSAHDRETSVATLVYAQNHRDGTISKRSSLIHSQFSKTQTMSANHMNGRKTLNMSLPQPQETRAGNTYAVHFLKTDDAFDVIRSKNQGDVIDTQELPGNSQDSFYENSQHRQNQSVCPSATSTEDKSWFIESKAFCNIATFDTKTTGERKQSFVSNSHGMFNDDVPRYQNSLNAEYPVVSPSFKSQKDVTLLNENQHQENTPPVTSLATQQVCRRSPQCGLVNCLEHQTTYGHELTFEESTKPFQFLPRDDQMSRYNSSCMSVQKCNKPSTTNCSKSNSKDSTSSYHNSYNDSRHTPARCCINSYENPSHSHNIGAYEHLDVESVEVNHHREQSEATGEYSPRFQKFSRTEMSQGPRKQHEHSSPERLSVYTQLSCFDDSGNEECMSVSSESCSQEITNPSFYDHEKIAGKEEFVQNISPTCSSKPSRYYENNDVMFYENEYFQPSRVCNNRYLSVKGVGTYYKSSIERSASSPNTCTKDNWQQSQPNVQTNCVTTSDSCHSLQLNKSASMNYDREQMVPDVGSYVDTDHVEPLKKRSKLQPEILPRMSSKSKSICTVSQYFKQLQGTQSSNSISGAVNQYCQPIVQERENLKPLYYLNKPEVKQNKLFQYCRKSNPIFQDTTFKKSRKKPFW